MQASKFQFQRTIDVVQLTDILERERTEQLGEQPIGFQQTKTVPPKFEVDVYRVEYQSTIPEKNNKPITAYGMIAIPRFAPGQNRHAPLLSFQHGTMLAKRDVPSYAFRAEYPDSYGKTHEIRLAVAQFAGNGFVVVAADYFGMGDSDEPEGYFVKKSHQQACLDLYLVCRKWLVQECQITIDRLFLTGWSQGGYVTMVFLQKLEAIGIEVKAVSSSTGPADLYALFMGFTFNGRDFDSYLLVAAVALICFSYQEYYGKPTLVDELFEPEHQPSLRAIYERSYTSSEQFESIVLSLSDVQDGKPKLSVTRLLRPAMRDPISFAQSTFAKLLRKNEAFSWPYKTQTRMFSGELDEWVQSKTVALTAIHQHAARNENVVRFEEIPNANHNGVSFSATYHEYVWFASLLD